MNILCASCEKGRAIINATSLEPQLIYTQKELVAAIVDPELFCKFLNYRSALRLTEPDRTLYLAIPEDVYDEFFRRRFIQRAIEEHQLKLLIFNPNIEEIVRWKN